MALKLVTRQQMANFIIGAVHEKGWAHLDYLLEEIKREAHQNKMIIGSGATGDFSNFVTILISDELLPGVVIQPPYLMTEDYYQNTQQGRTPDATRDNVPPQADAFEAQRRRTPTHPHYHQARGSAHINCDERRTENHYGQNVTKRDGRSDYDQPYDHHYTYRDSDRQSSSSNNDDDHRDHFSRHHYYNVTNEHHPLRDSHQQSRDGYPSIAERARDPRERERAALLGYKKFGVASEQADQKYQRVYEQTINGNAAGRRELVKTEMQKNRTPPQSNNTSPTSTMDEMTNYRTPHSSPSEEYHSSDSIRSSTSVTSSQQHRELIPSAAGHRSTTSSVSSRRNDTSAQATGSNMSLPSPGVCNNKTRMVSPVLGDFHEKLEEKTPLLANIWVEVKRGLSEELLENYINGAEAIFFGGSGLDINVSKIFVGHTVSFVEYNENASEEERTKKQKLAKELARELWEGDLANFFPLALHIVVATWQRHGPLELAQYDKAIKADFGDYFNHRWPIVLSAESFVKLGLLGSNIVKPYGKLVPHPLLKFVNLIVLDEATVENVVYDLLEQNRQMRVAQLNTMAMSDDESQNPFLAVPKFGEMEADERRDKVFDVIFKYSMLFPISSGCVEFDESSVIVLRR